MSKDQKQVVNQIKSAINKNSTTKLLTGAGSGWLAGMITVRAGRVPVALLGTSIILFQAAQNHGVIKQNWKDIRAKANQAAEGKQGVLDNAKKFAVENPAFTAGFTGGFLVGLAC